jgi:glycosyltransferase involved in cell wall biosynthesis
MSEIVYVTDIDLSRDNGAGVNERGFVESAMRVSGLVCVAPEPKYPDRYRNPLIRYAVGHFGSIWRYPFTLFSTWRILERMAARGEIGAIALRLGIWPIVPWLVARRHGLPIFLKSHSGYRPVQEEPWRRLWRLNRPEVRRTLKVRLNRLLAEPLRRRTTCAAALIDAPSRTCADAVRARYGLMADRVVVIPNGMDMERFVPVERLVAKAQLGLSCTGTALGYVGAINSDKRCLGQLIEALSRLKETADWTLFVVGEGPDRQALETQCVHLGIGDRVRFAGQRPNTEMPVWLSAFHLGVDLCAAPMRVGNKIRHAAYSQKMAQYLACGLPILAWDLPDNADLAPERVALLAKPFNIDDLASKIRSFLEMPVQVREEMATRALALGRGKYSYQALAEMRMKLWRDCLAIREG